MKKLNLFLAAFALFSMTAIAQTPGADYVDCPDCDIPVIECLDCDFDLLPTGMIGMLINTSDYLQMGVNNGANVMQNGTGNYSIIRQKGLMNILGGVGNYADVSQSGVRNHSDIKQDGEYNMGYVTQSGLENYTKQDVGVGYAQFNTATSTQTGENNVTFQKQRHDNNTATSTQNGNGNYAEQDQNSAGDLVAGSTATIDQNGNDHRAKQVQVGSNNTAYARQSGWIYSSGGNVSSENQVSDAGGTAWNDSQVRQYGNSNESCVDQMATDNGSNTSYVLQASDNAISGNDSYVAQSADNGVNESTVWQGIATWNGSGGTGWLGASDNLSKVDQTANSGGSNTSTVQQAITNNRSYVLQFADTDGVNSSTVSQFGDGNLVGVDQSASNGGSNTSTVDQGTYTSSSASSNEAYIYQSADNGFSNMSTASQIGSENWLCVNQVATGGNNTSVLTQDGIGNRAYINQNAFDASNMSTGVQIGNGNEACVIQTGDMSVTF